MIIRTVVFVIFFAVTAFAQDYLILLHGLGRTNKSMRALEERLVKENYEVLNLDYASRSGTIPFISDSLIAPEIESFYSDTSKKINFVTHSLGGIVVRYYLNRHSLPNLGRIVMLSPPNKGSEVVDFLTQFPLVPDIMGPAFLQLAADSNSFVNNLPAIQAEIGIITGKSSINFINSVLIPGPDDGKVSVESAVLEGMSDFYVVNRTHPFIMSAPEVLDQVVSFLQNGYFNKE